MSSAQWLAEQWLELGLVIGIALFAFARLIHAALDEGEPVGPLDMFVWLVSTYFILKGFLSLLLDWLRP
jgi:hypothetical protein